MKSICLLVALLVVFVSADEAQKNNAGISATFKQGTHADSDSKGDQSGGMLQASNSGKQVKSFPKNVKADAAPPAALDYSPNMTAVKNTGTICKSMYAMTTTSLLEWGVKNKLNQNLALSDQNLIDCDTKNKGCLGGDPVNSIIYSMSSGVSNGALYKYTQTNGTCLRSKYPSVYKLPTACAGELKGDETGLKSILATYGPLLVYMSVGPASATFDAYKSGVYSDAKCVADTTKIDRVYVLVGYGTDKTLGDFWILRNHVGATWGEKGYMRIKRGKNLCAIATYVVGVCKW